MKSNHSTNIFFIELIFAIFTFIIISTLCMLIFTKSHSLNQSANDTIFAVEKTQNLIELFYHDSASNNDLSYGEHYDYYNMLWERASSPDKSKYVIISNYYHDEQFNYLEVLVKNSKTDDLIFSQSVKCLF